MKCKIHPYSQDPGVCATCLRDRLFAVIAARKNRNSSEHPPPSSAYVSHRRSVGAGPSPSRFLHHHQCRFFSTPQVGPTTHSNYLEAASTAITHGSTKRSRNSGIKSWFSSLFKKQPNKPKEIQSVIDGYDDDDSGYSTESSTGWRRPEPTPVRRVQATARHSSKGVSGFAVCLSPLVRPSAKQTVDVGFSGDLRGAMRLDRHKRHVSAGAGPSRSRKLADHGRFR